MAARRAVLRVFGATRCSPASGGRRATAGQARARRRAVVRCRRAIRWRRSSSPSFASACASSATSTARRSSSTSASRTAALNAWASSRANWLAGESRRSFVTPGGRRSDRGASGDDTIPIVMLHAGNPIGAGLIASLAQPGGNVTGTANLPLGGKHVDLMREIASAHRPPRGPRQSRPTRARAFRREHERSRAQRRHRRHDRRSDSRRGLPKAFASIRNARPDWLHVADDPMIGTHRAEWVEFANGAGCP